MKLFNCNVRIGGNVLHDVPKYSISEMAIRVLQAMHGDDAVVNIKASGDADRTEKDEASILADAYGPKLVSEVSGIKMIAPLVVLGDDDESNDPPPAPSFSVGQDAAAPGSASLE